MIDVRWSLRVLVALPLLAAACLKTEPASAQSTSDLRRHGEELLSQNCSICHAVGRQGSSPHAMAPPFRTLSARYPIRSLEEGLGEGLMSGHPDMPEFVFEPSDVGAIIAYLESIQRR